ncbi:MAG: nitroreductase [Deltaproteobacteria bacterium]|nr:nitroreductase [Deltaproteobacteria bacterium]
MLRKLTGVALEHRPALDRRQFLGVLLMSTTALAQESRVIQLPQPQTTGGGELLQALKSRKSSRTFSARPLPQDLLSTLLWAAFGINRPATGGRTAPSAHDWQEIEVYAALPDALYHYDAAAHALILAVARDLRPLTGVQEFVAAAPLNLVYVADFSRMKDASETDRTFFAATDAAVIAQNVYLFCAAMNLAVVVRGLVDRKKLAPAMGLRRDQRIVLAQSVGYPAA